MKLVISTPELWFPIQDHIKMHLVGCLRRRQLTANVSDFDLREQKGLTMMFLESASEYSSEGEKLKVAECLNCLNEVLVQSHRDAFLDDLRGWSDIDRKSHPDENRETA